MGDLGTRFVAALVQVVVLCVVVVALYLAATHTLFKADLRSGREPSAHFYVVFLETLPDQGGKSQYGIAPWRRLPELMSSKPGITFLVPEKAAEIPMRSDSARFERIEDNGETQLIEVRYMNTDTSWSRYIAYKNRVVPLSQRSDGGPALMILVPIMLVIAYYVSRFASRIVRRRLGIEEKRSAVEKSK